MFKVKIPWVENWNEVCISVLEVFGLPGVKYVYHPLNDCMEFEFVSKKDAELCQILLSEKI